jgi:hypothetical protein
MTHETDDLKGRDIEKEREMGQSYSSPRVMNLDEPN